jgi:hypothetical protein
MAVKTGVDNVLLHKRIALHLEEDVIRGRNFGHIFDRLKELDRSQDGNNHYRYNNPGLLHRAKILVNKQIAVHIQEMAQHLQK